MKNSVKIIFPLLSVFICVSLCMASSPSLHIKIFRPGEGEVNFSVVVKKQYGDLYIPYGGARIDLSGGEGFQKTVTADYAGRAVVSSNDLLAHLNGLDKTVTLKASVTAYGQSVQDSLSFTSGEMDKYFNLVADSFVNKGNEAAKAGRFADAVRLFRKALAYNPFSLRAQYNTALAYEKMGMPNLAVDKYCAYLKFFAQDPKDRLELKRKVMSMVKTMEVKPPVPYGVEDLLARARLQFESDNPLEALSVYEAVQSHAPWLAEAYYGMGAVFEYLGNQKNPLHYASAIRNYELFLETASPDDARIERVKKQIPVMQSIESGMSQQETFYK